MGAECVGEFTVYKKGWLATLHRNPVKNLILFSYLPTKAHRPIYRDLGALVQSKYLHPSVRHIALIVGTWSRSSSSGSTGEQQSGAPDASSGDGMIITKPGRTETSAPTPLSLASNRPRLETLSSLSGTGSSNPSPSSGESAANLTSSIRAQAKG